MASKRKIIRCQGAVCWKRGEALSIEEINVDPPRQWEVRIKIICTSLFHSDLTFWSTIPEPRACFPRILGHEAVEIVESVGDGVSEFKEGDTVVPVFLANCNDCVDCKSEKSNMCSKVPFDAARRGMPRDGSSRFSSINGDTLHHFLCVSSFAEYTLVDQAQLVKIDSDIPPEKACLLSCGISTGLGAAWRGARVEKGSTVAIFGLGSIVLAVPIWGRNRLLPYWNLEGPPALELVVPVFVPVIKVAEGARIRGASRIIGVDLNAEKFQIGRRFGLTDFINPKDCGDKSVSKVIVEMTDGGADYCFECVGLSSLMTEAYRSTRHGWGKTVILGVEMKGTPFCIGYSELLSGKSVMGSLFGGTKAKIDIPMFANMYRNQELQLDPFVTHEVSLREINKMFDLMLEGKSLRCIIWMDVRDRNKL